MARVSFNDLQVFVTVARARSFTRAAEQLGVSKAQASKLVTALETALGVKLLHRTTRKLTLTTDATPGRTRGGRNDAL